MNTTTSQRIITSTWQRTNLDTSAYTGDDDYADVLKNAINKASRYARRESYSTEHGQKVIHAFVAEYTDPATGQTRYAACYEDVTGTEYCDYATCAEAEADYEQNVRDLQTCVDDQVDENGDPVAWFENCDVKI